MNTISIFIMILGFYAGYHTSTKKKSKKGKQVVLAGKNRDLLLNTSGLVLVACSFSIFISLYGLAAGIFFTLISLMSIGCLIVIIAPLNIVTYKHLLFFFLGGIFLEFLI